MKGDKKKKCLELLKKYLPENIQRHSIQVNKVAMAIARKFSEKGVHINSESLNHASLLHDIARVVDVKSLEREDLKKFGANPDEKTLKFWISVRKKYEGKKHYEAGPILARENGFSEEVASLIKAHQYEFIDFLSTWEEKIMYYADKRVAHDRIVSLKERLSDLVKRYRNGMLDEKTKAVHKKIFALEKEIFDKIDMNPEDLIMEA